MSIVHIAVDSNSILILAYFYYEKLLDFEFRDEHGFTPFLYAIWNQWIYILPIFWVLTNSKEAAFRILLSFDINFQAKDNFGNSALHLATKLGSIKMVFKIMMNFNNFNEKNNENETALSIAQENNLKQIESLFVRYLIFFNFWENSFYFQVDYQSKLDNKSTKVENKGVFIYFLAYFGSGFFNFSTFTIYEYNTLYSSLFVFLCILVDTVFFGFVQKSRF